VFFPVSSPPRKVPGLNTPKAPRMPGGLRRAHAAVRTEGGQRGPASEAARRRARFTVHALSLAFLPIASTFLPPAAPPALARPGGAPDRHAGRSLRYGLAGAGSCRWAGLARGRARMGDCDDDGPWSPGLPEGWAAATDDASGDTYYYNEQTGDSTWERPLAAAAPAEAPASENSRIGKLLASRRTFLRNVVIWFAVSWGYSKVFPSEESRRGPGSAMMAMGTGDEMMGMRAAAKEALTNSAQAEVVDAVSAALGETLVLQFGAFGAAMVPLFRPLALFATDLALDLQEEALVSDEREEEPRAPQAQRQGSGDESLRRAVTNAAGQTSTVVMARAAAAQTSLWLVLGDFGGIFDKPTVTKILIKTLTKVGDTLKSVDRERHEREHEREALPNGGCVHTSARTHSHSHSNTRTPARCAGTHACASTCTHTRTPAHPHTLTHSEA